MPFLCNHIISDKEIKVYQCISTPVILSNDQKNYSA